MGEVNKITFQVQPIQRIIPKHLRANYHTILLTSPIFTEICIFKSHNPNLIKLLFSKQTSLLLRILIFSLTLCATSAIMGDSFLLAFNFIKQSQKNIIIKSKRSNYYYPSTRTQKTSMDIV